RPAVGEPQGGCRISAIGHEFEPLGIGHETTPYMRRLKVDPMRWPFVVEAVSSAFETDSVDARWQRGKHTGRGLRARRSPIGIVGGGHGTLRERVQDVGEQQLLMLLLVMKTDLENAD